MFDVVSSSLVILDASDPIPKIPPMPRTISHPALSPLKARFPDTKFLLGEFRDMVTLVVPREAIQQVCFFLRDDPALRYDMLAELNGVDYLNFPGAPEQGRFAINY